MDDLHGFLHRHPKKEADANLDSEHVIVDKKEWETVRTDFKKYLKSYDLCRDMAIAYTLKKGNIEKSEGVVYFNRANEIVPGGMYYKDIDVLLEMDKTRCDMDLPDNNG